MDLRAVSQRVLASKWRFAILPLVFAVLLALAHW
jgi:hypothetical protein